MEPQARFAIDLARLNPEGERLAGVLVPEVLDLGASDEIAPQSGLFYDLFVEPVGSELLVRGQVWQEIRSLCSRCGGGI